MSARGENYIRLSRAASYQGPGAALERMGKAVRKLL